MKWSQSILLDHLLLIILVCIMSYVNQHVFFPQVPETRCMSEVLTWTTALPHKYLYCCSSKLQHGWLAISQICLRLMSEKTILFGRWWDSWGSAKIWRSCRCCCLLDFWQMRHKIKGRGFGFTSNGLVVLQKSKNVNDLNVSKLDSLLNWYQAPKIKGGKKAEKMPLIYILLFYHQHPPALLSLQAVVAVTMVRHTTPILSQGENNFTYVHVA